jgi:hypothetical protein
MTTTLTAAYQMVFNEKTGFLARFRDPAQDHFKWGLNLFLTAVMVGCLIVIVADSIRRWRRPLRPNVSPAPVV